MKQVFLLFAISFVYISKSAYRWPSLEKALSYDDHAEVMHRLKMGANKLTKDGNGNSPLIIFAKHGYMQAVKELLDIGANPNDANKAGQTVLEFAASRGHEDIVRLLIGQGARVDIQDAYGNTILMAAVLSDNPRIIDMILGSGNIHLNIQSASGLTALMIAAINNKPESIKFLLARGANPYLCDKIERLTAAGFAKREKNIFCAQLIQNHLDAYAKIPVPQAPVRTYAERYVKHRKTR